MDIAVALFRQLLTCECQVLAGAGAGEYVIEAIELRLAGAVLCRVNAAARELVSLDIFIWPGGMLAFGSAYRHFHRIRLVCITAV